MTTNFFGNFQQLKIQQQLLLLIIVSAAIPAFAVGTLGVTSAGNTLGRNATELLREEAQDSAEETATFLTGYQ